MKAPQVTKIFISCLLILIACKDRESVSLSGEYHMDSLIKRLDSVGAEYLKWLRHDNSILETDTLFLHVRQNDKTIESYMAFDFYISSRPIKGDAMPVHFNHIKQEKFNDVIFLYSKSIPSDSLSMLLTLQKKELLANDPFDNYALNDFPTWTYFLCSKNPLQFKIVMSDSTIKNNFFEQCDLASSHLYEKK